MTMMMESICKAAGVDRRTNTRWLAQDIRTSARWPPPWMDQHTDAADRMLYTPTTVWSF